MELKDTINMMTSEDYRDRFKAEYWQTRIRREKLDAMLCAAEAGTLEFEPCCPVELLCRQEEVMAQYLTVLEERAQIEGIDLTPAPALPETVSFTNTRYSDEWEQGYETGTAAQRPDGGWAVYDGGQNLMGYVKLDGGIVYNGTPSDYKESFLLSAKEVLGL